MNGLQPTTKKELSKTVITVLATVFGNNNSHFQQFPLLSHFYKGAKNYVKGAKKNMGC